MWNFKRLIVWKRSRSLVVDIYRATSGFPPEERYLLAAQMRRAAISIGANIAEGSGREQQRDRARFLEIAIGSTNELENHLLVAQDIALLEADHAMALMVELDEIRMMLRSLRSRCLEPD